MLQRRLGTTGWQVGVISLGTWNIGGQWGPVDDTTAIQTILSAVEAGVNLIDTADAYGEPPGRSEALVGQALKQIKRDRVYVATKVGNWSRRFGHPLPYTHWQHVTLCCDASLYRLGIDCIDLYQNHTGNTEQVEVFLEGFERLQQAGKIRHFGISTHLVAAAQAYHRTGKLAAVQLDYSLLHRQPEMDLLPWCAKHEIGTLIRGPLAQGIAAGKFRPDTQFTDSVRSRWNSGAERERFLDRLMQVERVRFLEQGERTLAQAALQFVISHPAVTTAIPGAKSPEQARANAAAGAATLTAEEWARVQTVLPVK